LLVPDTALPGWHPAYILRQGAAGVKPSNWVIENVTEGGIVGSAKK
jgi:hypothetical protein